MSVCGESAEQVLLADSQNAISRTQSYQKKSHLHVHMYNASVNEIFLQRDMSFRVAKHL
jgi:hypothetical protein